MRRLFPVLALTVLSASSVSAYERQAGNHTHGEAHLTVAVDGTVVAVTLEAPGADVVGFETGDGSSEQLAQIEAAIETLKEAATVLAFDPAAGCALETAEVEAEGYGLGAGHDHDHAAGHAAFVASYRFTCASTPSGFEVTLLDTYTGLGAVEVDALRAGQVLSVEVGPSGGMVNW